MNKFSLSRVVQILLLFILLIGLLYFARSFLIPVCLAAILAMLFAPLSAVMERRGVHRGFAAVICILILLAIIASITVLISWQISNLSNDITEMEKHFNEMFARARLFISDTFGVSEKELEQIFKKQQSAGSASITNVASIVLGSFMNIIVNAILVIVYIFLFMFFRKHLKEFVLKLVAPKEKQEACEIIFAASKVSQQYLSGLAMMIGILWVMYGIGFSIVGVKYAIFFAVLCGLLEIIPFIGNLTGTSLTVLMVMAQGGSTNMVLGVLGTYCVVQFIQSYILEPLVVGRGVNINALFTIMVIVAGETIWGVAGMIMAIPLLGIMKIICDHVEPLKPYGFLIGENKSEEKENKLKTGIIGIVKKLKSKK